MHTKNTLIKSILASVFYTSALIFDLSILVGQNRFDSGNQTIIFILSLIIILAAIFIFVGLYKGKIYVLARYREYGYQYKTSAPLAFYTMIIYRSLIMILAIIALLMIYK
jgi:hypothetical protein